ncbi:MAG TPA: tRNA (adenosine(37)-N6)-threonylcarbamoyltransferase complex dimerization subunit type 1 TsaB [Candidatus Saccharimonadales bacterium]|nr:tRNA (adenosine(37)-N6)-threonylcarbamoyltransferase complex dimerization subunit type 1 TsaB [Candidatus Saccharimonadales bacterium]
MILAIKTDKPEATLSLLGEKGEVLATEEWLAHRQLSDTILTKIDELLASGDVNLQDLRGVVVFKGPGSFTGLRLGVTVANTLAYSLRVPVVGVEGADWQANGCKSLAAGKDDRIVLPVYGGGANITLPRK